MKRSDYSFCIKHLIDLHNELKLPSKYAILEENELSILKIINVTSDDIAIYRAIHSGLKIVDQNLGIVGMVDFYFIILLGPQNTCA